MTQFTFTDIQNMSSRYRVHFINSLSGFKSANLVGTVSKNQESNLAIISSAFHIGAEPALMGFINRPHSVDRHTLENLIETGYYTLNHVHTHIIDQAHQTSARYEREQSEFTETGLQEHWVDGIPAPFVAESHVRIGLRYKEHHDLLNGTVMVIGEVIHVEVPENSINNDGLIDLHQCESVVVSGLDTYHTPNKGKRLAYAKPNQSPQVLEK
jgi:flavin reductase (DIM6/NTAB) family NADH-FMN oxidoreductase RutF